jgi:hypothetical protein
VKPARHIMMIREERPDIGRVRIRIICACGDRISAQAGPRGALDRLVDLFIAEHAECRPADAPKVKA